MFRPPSLLAPQIVPTAAILPQGSRGFYVRAHRALLPPHAPDMLTVRIQAIDGTGTCTLSRIAQIGGAECGAFEGRQWRARGPEPPDAAIVLAAAQDQAFGGPCGPVLTAAARDGSPVLRSGRGEACRRGVCRGRSGRRGGGR